MQPIPLSSRARILLVVILSVFFGGCVSTGGNGGGSGASYLQIENRAKVSVYYLYISPCSSSGWGSDQLETDVIISGSNYRFAMTPGCWDLRAEMSNGQETERFGVQMGYGDSKVWTIY